ncbi:MAG TPA: enoyl-CoA hydratase [Mycobacteriales bacterium]|jgi:Enoyl-CoA hydratase/carnithine racemase
MTTNHGSAGSEPGSPVRLLRRDAVAEIVLSRPERRNALDAATGAALLDAVEEVRHSDQIRAVVLRGAGEAFCAGGDVKAMAAGVRAGRGEPLLREISRAVHNAIVAIVRLPKPVIACVHGPAHGAGFSLALACDLVVAAQDATFCQAFVRIGATPDSGSSFFLPRLVGRQIAAELILLGDVVDAAEAHRLGLVNRVVPRDELHDHVLALAERLTHGPAAAYAGVKRLLGAAAVGGLEQHLEEERRCLGEMAATDDFREGVEAFVARRPARFGAGGPAPKASTV